MGRIEDYNAPLLLTSLLSGQMEALAYYWWHPNYRVDRVAKKATFRA